jgi:Uma2 family endonuclease
VQPDIFVVRVTEAKRPAYPFDLSNLLLVVEVESPTNSSYDYQTKRLLYVDGGVPQYWIVSPDARTIARWRGTEEPGEILSRQLVWQPEGMSDPFVLDVPDLFAQALG